jgi:hypothetical protein
MELREKHKSDQTIISYEQNESIVKKVTDITFRSGINPKGKTAWKIIFHF